MKKKTKKKIKRLQHDADCLAGQIKILYDEISKAQCRCENYKPKTVTFKRFLPVEELFRMQMHDRKQCEECIKKDHCDWRKVDVPNWLCADGEK